MAVDRGEKQQKQAKKQKLLLEGLKKAVERGKKQQKHAKKQKFLPEGLKKSIWCKQGSTVAFCHILVTFYNLVLSIEILCYIC